MLDSMVLSGDKTTHRNQQKIHMQHYSKRVSDLVMEGHCK